MPKLAPRRSSGGFTLVEVLLVMAIIGIVAALILAGISRSKDKANLTKCRSILHQFHLAAVMATHENDGRTPSFGELLKQSPMVCPSDKGLGATGKLLYKAPSSYEASAFIFGAKGALDAADPSKWVLSEFRPYHDQSAQAMMATNKVGRTPGKRNTLFADGSIKLMFAER